MVFCWRCEQGIVSVHGCGHVVGECRVVAWKQERVVKLGDATFNLARTSDSVSDPRGHFPPLLPPWSIHFTSTSTHVRRGALRRTAWHRAQHHRLVLHPRESSHEVQRLGFIFDHSPQSPADPFSTTHRHFHSDLARPCTHLLSKVYDSAFDAQFCTTEVAFVRLIAALRAELLSSNY